YWWDGDTTERRLEPVGNQGRQYTFEIPPPGRTAVLYYYFTTEWPPAFRRTMQTTPPAGRSAPFVYFVSQDHLGDLDVHGDLVDVFDVVRLARHAAWGEPVPFVDALQRAGIASAPDAVAALLRPLLKEDADHVVAGIGRPASEVRFQFSARSAVDLPRRGAGLVSGPSLPHGHASTPATTTGDAARRDHA